MAALQHSGLPVRGFDHAVDPVDDVRDRARVEAVVAEARGVVHLAAMSRVAWAHADPDGCWATNVTGTQHVVEALRPEQWVLFASSREVYGTPASLPATEDAPLRPLNVYARAKIEGERLARSHPGRGAVVRLSNAYGDTLDHADRVLPAFARAAATGRTVRVDGGERTFDFVHIRDVVRGLMALVGSLEEGRVPPVVHLTTGVGTSLGALAELACRTGAAGQVAGPERDFDVERFVGDPGRAHAVLDWRAEVSVEQGFAALVAAYREGGDQGM